MEAQNGTRNKLTTAGLLIALGVIYGDIGTSPLYVLKAICGNAPISKQTIIGSISCIIWTLTLLTTIKYVWIALRADNQGEGGIFSLYSLVRKYSKKLVIPTILGASTLLADGIITPAISVTSAVEGLMKVKIFDESYIVLIVIIIISMIFLVQRLGSQKVGKAFGPIMTVWFSMLFILGALQIRNHLEVLEAFNPMSAYHFLTQNKNAIWVLGAVFLCTTGAEALYSDLGHCGKKNIRTTWVFVKISLIINYLGQGAWLLQHKGQLLNGRNPFFEIMPEWFLLTGIGIATLSACIASQALITGSYTLISEAINLNFWPRVAVKQPSESKGQMYIPSINVILWLGCVILVVIFKTSEHMEAAYGLAITLTMLTTTYMLTYYLVYKLKLNKILAFGFALLFFTIEGTFFAANAIKFTEGGYIMIIVAGLFFSIMYTTYYGRKYNNKYTKFTKLQSHIEKILSLSDDNDIPKYATHLIYLTKANTLEQIEERILESIFSKKPKRADVYWLIHINWTNEPYTLDYEVHHLHENKIIRIDINIGFRIQPRTELYFKRIIKDMITANELNPVIYKDASRKYTNKPDFQFILAEKFISVENDFSLYEGLLLKSYFFLKSISQKDEKAFGLDKSDVIIEHSPLIYNPVPMESIHRKIK